MHNPPVLDQPTVVLRSLSAINPSDADAEAVTQVLRVVTPTTAARPAAALPVEERRIVSISPRPLVIGALVVALTLAALHFGAVAIASGLPGSGFRVPDAVKLGNETTVATWFSSVLDLINAALLAVLATTAPAQERWRWVVTTLAVLAVSFDEVSGFHEDLSGILHNALHTTGVLTDAWVLPALLVAFVVGLLCATIIIPRPGGRAVLAGGLVYVAGAAGVGVFEGWWSDATGLGGDDLVFSSLDGLGETTEMIGAIIAMGGLLRMASGTGLRVLADPPREGVGPTRGPRPAGPPAHGASGR